MSLCAKWTVTSFRGALFLDRDGVIIQDKGYVNSEEQTEFIPECIEAIKIAKNHGLYVFIITNQAGVSRKYFSEDECRDFNLWLVQALERQGAMIDELVYCPSHPDFSLGSEICKCRKPDSGMLDYLISKWNLNKEKSLVLGDKQSDCEAGAIAGIKAKLITNPADTLSAVREFILSHESFGSHSISSTK